MNKLLLPRLGPKAYFALSSLVKVNSSSSELVLINHHGKKARLLLRLDRRGEKQEHEKQDQEKQKEQKKDDNFPIILNCKVLKYFSKLISLTMVRA